VSDEFTNSDVELVEGAPQAPDPFGGESPSRVLGGVLGLMGFVTALLVGLLSSNPGTTIITRAIIALIVCAVIGRVLGRVGEVCVREFLDRYRAERPIPEMPEALKRLYKKRADAEALKGRFSSTT
jgi:hypothetical protein